MTPGERGSYNHGSMRRLQRILCALAVLAGVSAASAHTVYVAPDNHTDYGWNASTTTYDGTMLQEIDYYLGRIAATQDEFTDQRARFNADGWWYLWLYEHQRTPSQFQALVDAMQSGHIQVPLNPHEREVEEHLLPLAADRGVGVVVMRPLGQGPLARRSPPAKELSFLGDYGLRTWAQALLNWRVSDPRVSVSIPATANPAHLADNCLVGGARRFEAAARERVAALAARV